MTIEMDGEVLVIEEVKEGKKGYTQMSCLLA